MLSNALVMTVALIVMKMAATYVPLLITLNIAEYALINLTDKDFIAKVVTDLMCSQVKE